MVKRQNRMIAIVEVKMNSDRRTLDSSGRSFMPKNMDISDANDAFMSTPKLFTAFGLFAMYAIWFIWAGTSNLNFIGYVITFIPLTFIAQIILRLVIFQERYYYKIWCRDKEIGNPKPSIFWSISSVRTSSLGDVLVFSDMKMGCVLELEKDTIIGRASDNEERHYDAWSEFYKQINLAGYSFVQLNVMEPAGKDVRLTELSDIAVKSPNDGVKLVLEASVGYMKEISRATLNERDYILIYTTNLNKLDTIVSDVVELGSEILNGAYAAARVLSAKEVFTVMQDIWNVSVFNGVEAQMEVYRHSGIKMTNPFKLVNIYKDDMSKVVEVTPQVEKRLTKASTLLSNARITVGDWNIDDILRGKYDSIDLDTVLAVNYTEDIEEVLTKREERKRKEKEYQEKLKQERKAKKDKKQKQKHGLFSKKESTIKLDKNNQTSDNNFNQDNINIEEEEDYFDDMNFDSDDNEV